MGRLLARIAEYGIDEKTVVMFSSDNGHHDEGGHDTDRFDPNGPLRELVPARRSVAEQSGYWEQWDAETGEAIRYALQAEDGSPVSYDLVETDQGLRLSGPGGDQGAIGDHGRFTAHRDR